MGKRMLTTNGAIKPKFQDQITLEASGELAASSFYYLDCLE
jgi:hypothetical protein